jgi:predicted ribonuclease YlaK
MFEPGEEIASFAIWINPMMENLSSLHNKRSVTASWIDATGR